MTIQHHPGDDLLLAQAAGRLASGPALLVDTHLESCLQCRVQLQGLQSLGGALIDEAEPELLAPDALARTWARIDAGVPAAAAVTASGDASSPMALSRPVLPQGLMWPRSLRGSAVSRWHWMGPGMRWSRVTLPYDPEASLFLLHIGPDRSLPRHTHTGLELTQVLCGAFDDERAVFSAGDFDTADGDVHHQPVVRAGADCVCLAYVAAPLKFDGKLASLVGGWIGM